jgi:hypothetical protein
MTFNVKLPPPNRIAAYLTAGASLAGAAAPVVADLDLASTAGVLGGVAGLIGVYRAWLPGWREHEAREARMDWTGHVDPPAPAIDAAALEGALREGRLLYQELRAAQAAAARAGVV